MPSILLTLLMLHDGSGETSTEAKGPSKEAVHRAFEKISGVRRARHVKLAHCAPSPVHSLP